MLSQLFRILTLRADTNDFRSLDRNHLLVGLACVWLVGIGRYWDNPRVEVLQKTGLGSLVYVFVLSGLLWVVGLALRPRRWSYRNLLTFVCLTAPPGLLYAIPVEQVLTAPEARSTNAVFLGVVAVWRVAMYGVYLARYADLPPVSLIVQLLLPLTLIVTALSALNLERAVFDLMGGLEATTSADSAYEVLVLLTLASVVLFPILLVVYIILAVIRRRATTGDEKVA